jgi:propionyl-CoA synthetase
VEPGAPARRVPGGDIRVVDEQGRGAKRGETGAVVARLPLPPGCLPTLWNADQRYKDSYLKAFPGFYQTGDAGFMDDDGYLYIMARTDDIINVAGHRLSTGAMEEVLSAHPDVAECAVIGVADQLKGQVPLGFLVLKAGVERASPVIVQEVVQMVRDRIGPVAAFKSATVIKRLPKTRSGKILRGTMQKIADGLDYKLPATIDDPAILPVVAPGASLHLDDAPPFAGAAPLVPQSRDVFGMEDKRAEARGRDLSDREPGVLEQRAVAVQRHPVRAQNGDGLRDGIDDGLRRVCVGFRSRRMR